MNKLIIPEDLWLKFGCFLSGHNYKLLSECSETSKKYVRKLTSALLIICTIWSFVGYLFATRYAESGVFGGIIGSLFAGLIIIQIERQIILGSTKNIILTLVIRGLLGLIVAFIGALILDQVFFKNDIARKKEDLIEARISERTQIINNKAKLSIAQLDSNNSIINSQIGKNNEIIAKSGFKIQLATSTTKVSTPQNPVENTPGNTQTTTNKTFGSHPLLSENANLRQQIAFNDNLKNKEINELQGKLEKEKDRVRKEPPGFLDELNIIHDLATSSFISAFAYFIFLFFFVFIELFIVIAKFSDGENDYYKIVAFQEKIREERLIILEKKRAASLGSDQNIDATNSLITNTPR
ncbi:DUF4407 domain-containing protein [Aquirufa antheringensis]|jgi:phosphate/sulfate permease|uniref:DUF4407 domain-containing protein n=1 Tax=Aquirufa antheringensis TaxID=2516559 RepID=UPI00208F6C92|nr:DUF4407 domain-containing protein [Aquirufa antheringensis]USQ03895.1 DUF4407 domain-containing protein [Aquirufa antheringensis]